jgi:hypothetical protein
MNPHFLSFVRFLKEAGERRDAAILPATLFKQSKEYSLEQAEEELIKFISEIPVEKLKVS